MRDYLKNWSVILLILSLTMWSFGYQPLRLIQEMGQPSFLIIYNTIVEPSDVILYDFEGNIIEPIYKFKSPIVPNAIQFGFEELKHDSIIHRLGKGFFKFGISTGSGGDTVNVFPVPM